MELIRLKEKNKKLATEVETWRERYNVLKIKFDDNQIQFDLMEERERVMKREMGKARKREDDRKNEIEKILGEVNKLELKMDDEEEEEEEKGKGKVNVMDFTTIRK